jgi:tetraacyldisaccharide 4'-kinase
VILGAASAIYGTAASWRRRWYAGDPTRRRRLDRPVVSVGNLRAGGSGKTPLVAHLARLLAEHGERPAILSRGYARRVAPDGVTVVSDGARIRADAAASGDEPLMLARALPGVPVLVGADRYLSGRLAERRLGATVHLLDDGFQHLSLARDADLLLAGEDDLDEPLLPAGRLREPLSAAAAADALLVDGGAGTLARVRKALGVEPAFAVRRMLHAPRWLATGEAADLAPDEPVFVAAGIARPQRFLDDLAEGGWRVKGTMMFRDHHWFTAADVQAIARAAGTAGAGVVLTTEKDGIRLEACGVAGLRVAVVPLTVRVEAPEFAAWLLGRIHRAGSTPRRSGDDR